MQRCTAKEMYAHKSITTFTVTSRLISRHIIQIINNTYSKDPLRTRLMIYLTILINAHPKPGR